MELVGAFGSRRERLVRTLRSASTQGCQDHFEDARITKTVVVQARTPKATAKRERCVDLRTPATARAEELGPEHHLRNPASRVHLQVPRGGCRGCGARVMSSAGPKNLLEFQAEAAQKPQHVTCTVRPLKGPRRTPQAGNSGSCFHPGF